MATLTKTRIVKIPDTVKVNADEIAPAHTNGNGFHHQAVAPKRRRPMEVMEVLINKVIDTLTERGWTTGTLERPDGRVCLVGAINVVTMKDPMNSDRYRSNPSRTALIDHLNRHLPRGSYDGDSVNGKESALVGFNDRNNNKRRVMNLLHRALEAAKK